VIIFCHGIPLVNLRLFGMKAEMEATYGQAFTLKTHFPASLSVIAI